MTEWRYLPAGRVVHAHDGPPRRWYGRAWCGTRPMFEADWYGTGTQDEYEHAASLPKCKRCLAQAEPPRAAE